MSRSDWLTELRAPQKAMAWSRHCHQWLLVVPDRSIVRAGELPDGWGLMVPDSTGKLRLRTAPTPRQPDPLPTPVLAQLARAALRGALVADEK